MGEWIGVAIALVSSCLGGSAAAITRYLVGNADPITLAILRWGIGFACLLPAALCLRVRWPPRRDWPAVAAAGAMLLRLVLRPLQHRDRLHHRGPRQPRARDLAAAHHGGRRAARRRAADACAKRSGVCVAVLGVIAALAAGLSAAPPGAWRGELIMTGAVFCMAFYNVWSRPFIQRSSALGFLTVGMGAGAAALIVVGLLTGSVAVLRQPQYAAMDRRHLSRRRRRRAGVHPVGPGAERATPTRVASTMTVNPIAAGLLATQLVGRTDHAQSGDRAGRGIRRDLDRDDGGKEAPERVGLDGHAATGRRALKYALDRAGSV